MNFYFEKDLSSYESQLRNVEEERDRFRRELNKYKRSSREKVSKKKVLAVIDDDRMKWNNLSPNFIFLMHTVQ